MLAVEGVFAAVALAFGYWPVALMFVVTTPLALIPVRGRSTADLVIGPDGLRFHGVDIPWSNVDRTDDPRPPWTWAPGLALKRPLTYPRWLSPFDVTRVPIAMYEANWRKGGIGADIARWAPHLLEDRAPVKA